MMYVFSEASFVRWAIIPETLIIDWYYILPTLQAIALYGFIDDYAGFDSNVGWALLEICYESDRSIDAHRK